MKTYEGLFIFEDSLRDEALEDVLNRVRDEITRLGGIVKATFPMGRKTFARPMKKREMGVFVRIVFELATEQIAPLQARYNIGEDVFRVQIVLGDERTPTAEPAVAEEEQGDGESK